MALPGGRFNLRHQPLASFTCGTVKITTRHVHVIAGGAGCGRHGAGGGGADGAAAHEGVVFEGRSRPAQCGRNFPRKYSSRCIRALALQQEAIVLPLG